MPQNFNLEENLSAFSRDVLAFKLLLRNKLLFCWEEVKSPKALNVGSALDATKFVHLRKLLLNLLIKDNEQSKKKSYKKKKKN